MDSKHQALCYKSPNIKMTQRKSKSVKNLDLQLTSHEASRYLEIAKGTECPRWQSCPCFTDSDLASTHISSPREVTFDASPRPSGPPLPSLGFQHHGGNSAGWDSGDEVQKSSTILTNHLTPFQASLSSAVKFQ